MPNHPNLSTKTQLRESLSESVGPEDLKAIRLSLGLSQPAMGKSIGLTGNAIYMMETGRMAIEKRTQIAVKTLEFLGKPTKEN